MSGQGFGGCGACEGRCCRQYIVPVTCADVHGISRALALAPEQFALLVPESEQEPAGIRLAAGGPTFTIILDKREPMTERPPCVFLMEFPDGTGRCGIYRHRPRACRTFPAALRDGGLAILPDIPCTTDSWDLGSMDQPWWRTELLHGETEQALHRIVVAGWNGAVDAATERTPSDFFRFAMETCDRLDAMRSRCTPEELLERAAGVVGSG
jgi:Fe-S-cluster containining protein